MKVNFTLFLLSFFALLLPAQIQLIVQPSAAAGKDSHVAMSSNGYDGGGGNATTLFNSAWTQSGVPFTHRSMVEFDLSALPANVTILDAKLNLYAYNQAETHSQRDGSNACWIERITSDWDEAGVKWSNQPSSTTTNRVEIPGTSDGAKDYELNVTNLIQDMANDPTNSFGFLLKLQNEVRYRMMTFCTSDHPDATKHPKLTITYEINTGQLSLRPNAADGKDSHVAMSSNGYDGGGGNATTLFNSAWTQSGVPFTHRSMVEFDLSALPANVTILDAKLNLYAYNQAETHSQRDGSNACWIERITSDWDEAGVKWSNQPSSTTTNRVEIPGTSDGAKDYELNVTNLVQDMADDPTNSFGFLLKLQNEVRYRMMTFCTSDHPDATKHPQLTITYEINTGQLNLRPNAADGKDTHVAMSSNGYDGGGGNAPLLFNSAWTQSGVPFTHRSMVAFDLSSIPTNATITSAQLNLFAYDGPEMHSQRDGSNACWIERITSDWDEDAVKWSTQPSTSITNRIEIPGTSDVTKDYELDVKNLVQDMVNDPTNSFGFFIRLQTESYYRSMSFCTSDYADASKHPQLIITYEINTNQLSLRPNGAAGKDSHVAMSSNGYDGGGGNATTLFNSAWTQSGVPFTHRSMVEFDLSALPANVTILDAKLNLYAYNQAETHSQRDGSNACWIERITSDWDEAGVKWSNQPSSTTTNRVEIPGTSDGAKDYELNVTNLVQDMADDPTNSFGFLLKLQNEVRYRMMTFCTSDHADATKHPSLELTYKIRDNGTTCAEETYIVGRTSGAYTAKKIITTTGVVEVGETATFIAPVVSLEPGFYAKAGSTVLIQSGENCMAEAFTAENTNTQSRTAASALPILTTAEALVPTTLSIAPNPFNHQTELQFSIPSQTVGHLAVFNANGQLVQTLFERKQLEKGMHTFSFQQRFLEKGLFYFVLKTEREVIVSKGVSH